MHFKDPVAQANLEQFLWAGNEEDKQTGKLVLSNYAEMF